MENIVSIQQNRIEWSYKGANGVLSSYPVAMSSFLISPDCTLDTAGVPYPANQTGYDPATVTHYALASWNEYLTTGAENHRKAFLKQAYWLIDHESPIGDDAGGWPISLPRPYYHSGSPWLSALVQGSALSVLLRAYQLTHEEKFLAVVQRVVRTFERDILDGGVSTPVGADGIFFEEVAVYPAAHKLSGFIFALFGLYDYVAFTGSTRVEELIQRSLTTMHDLLNEFDTGFWTRSDLLNGRLATPSHLALQSTLLEALAGRCGCEHCETLASRWKHYQRRPGSRLRYLITSRCAAYGRYLWGRAQAALFPTFQNTGPLRVCVPVTGFPVTGGIRTVLVGVAQVTEDIWRIEYLTQHVGPHSEGFVIHRFGLAKMSPWQFPVVWLYFLAGFRKLISLMHHGARYHVILPQDGVFTGAFAALAARLAGVRVVCIDHGNLTLLKNRFYRVERLKALATRSHLYRLVGPLLYRCYWPSLYLLASLATRYIDHFLIPGIPGDGVEEACNEIGIPASRITRFASMIDVDRHPVLDAISRTDTRKKYGIASDAILIVMVCRLAPEKGIDIALESISQALAELSSDLRERVRIVIAGDGSLRQQIADAIHLRDLSRAFLLWGETSAQDVTLLLSISDIFLYTSTRGACFSMAVLEAMAAGCGVIASTEPKSNAHLLAEGRGIAVPPGDVEQTAGALARLVNDLDLCHHMGVLARDYIAAHHSAALFRRALQRVTCWSSLDEFLHVGMECKTNGIIDLE
jgi:glycosyltransferase involved in cell wall biosynthesis